MIGILLMSLSIGCFGLIEPLTSKGAIISISIALRIGQGAASGMINTSIYSFASQAYPSKVDKIISLMEGVVGVGCTLGPMVGSFVY